MSFYYSSNFNVQYLIALLKANGIRKVIASPGTTNLELIASFQHDPYFEMYSCVDERSAAYMACGLSTDSGEPVVITCTEATASRNYLPGLTEAFHRKLPILAITGLHDYYCVGNLEPQVIDRNVSPIDSVGFKVNLPVIQSEADKKESQLLINKAILALKKNGGGPVHINMPWGGGNFDFSVQDLPAVQTIRLYYQNDKMPPINAKRIVVFIGTHCPWGDEESRLLDVFCGTYNAVAFCDHTGKYYGKYRTHVSLLAAQKEKSSIFDDIDLVIHIGEETGDGNLAGLMSSAKEVWRVSPDGEIRDTFGKLSCVFAMPESVFFRAYGDENKPFDDSYLKLCFKEEKALYDCIPDLPFSSIYVAQKISSRIPENSRVHLGVSDTIRAWSFFDMPENVYTFCNSGCRGIDGCVSAMVGASFSHPEFLYYCIVGDLTFFYDMNVLGNRHIGNNIRILLLNNDGGNIFRHHGHASQKWLGYEKANLYIAAGGHFGKQSKEFVKAYSEALGFEYMAALDKEQFDLNYERFVTPLALEKPLLFEVFTNYQNDGDAFGIMSNIPKGAKGKAKETIKHFLGDNGTSFVKSILKR